ncbi:hypothetical protein B0H13DRAFT_1936449 [Mycena leptocephala]|nr:hypothetical protein B0H13DRAFT_1936449 [Mycena leptocephala]
MAEVKWDLDLDLTNLGVTRRLERNVEERTQEREEGKEEGGRRKFGLLRTRLCRTSSPTPSPSRAGSRPTSGSASFYGRSETRKEIHDGSDHRGWGFGISTLGPESREMMHMGRRATEQTDTDTGVSHLSVENTIRGPSEGGFGAIQHVNAGTPGVGVEVGTVPTLEGSKLQAPAPSSSSTYWVTTYEEKGRSAVKPAGVLTFTRGELEGKRHDALCGVGSEVPGRMKILALIVHVEMCGVGMADEVETCEDRWRVRPKARKEEKKKAGLDSEYIEPWKDSERDRLDGLGCAQGGT